MIATPGTPARERLTRLDSLSSPPTRRPSLEVFPGITGRMPVMGRQGRLPYRYYKTFCETLNSLT
jgi:hypothetical protein